MKSKNQTVIGYRMGSPEKFGMRVCFKLMMSMFRMDNSDNRDYLLPHKMDSSLEDWVER